MVTMAAGMCPVMCVLSSTLCTAQYSVYCLVLCVLGGGCVCFHRHCDRNLIKKHFHLSAGGRVRINIWFYTQGSQRDHRSVVEWSGVRSVPRPTRGWDEQGPCCSSEPVHRNILRWRPTSDSERWTLSPAPRSCPLGHRERRRRQSDRPVTCCAPSSWTVQPGSSYYRASS